MKPLIVEICVGTSCHLLGSQDLFDAIESLPEETREKIEIQGTSCFQSCRKGPNVRINGIVLAEMTPDRLIAVILDNLA
jgi:NADH:ubiquinone oxidoreductase subunit E